MPNNLFIRMFFRLSISKKYPKINIFYTDTFHFSIVLLRHPKNHIDRFICVLKKKIEA